MGGDRVHEVDVSGAGAGFADIPTPSLGIALKVHQGAVMPTRHHATAQHVPTGDKSHSKWVTIYRAYNRVAYAAVPPRSRILIGAPLNG